MLRTDRKPEGGQDVEVQAWQAGSKESVSQIDFGVKALQAILPKNLNRGDVVTMQGPPATFKSTLAINFVARGLADGESAMIVRLAEHRMLGCDETTGSLLDKDKPRLSEELLAAQPNGLPLFRWEWMECASIRQPRQPIREAVKNDDRERTMLEYDRTWGNLAPRSKVVITTWRLTNEGLESLLQHRGKADTEPTRRERLSRMRLFELDYRGGAVLPEEFVHIIREILIRRTDAAEAIRRVAFGDVSQIGISYPFLRQSISTGGLFLPAFVHIMRNHGIDLVMTGTTGDLAPANEAVNRALSLADATLSCDLCDVFGDRHVVVRGPGQMSTASSPLRSEGELVPAVVQVFDIKHQAVKSPDQKPPASATPPPKGDPASAVGQSPRLTKTPAFRVDDKYLEGLVGFDTPPIHRPGVTVHLFEENSGLHGAYNREIEAMLSAALLSSGRPGELTEHVQADSRGGGVPPRVHVQPFGSGQSAAIHDSLSVLRPQAPLEETVLYTVDEFGAELSPTEGKSEAQQSARFHSLGKELTEILLPKLAIRSKERFKSSACFWPYYSNVLLLAYRKDWIEKFDPKCWADVRNAARRLKPPTADADLQIQRRFWYDRTASETLACALLDALVCGSEHLPNLVEMEKLSAATDKERAHKQAKLFEAWNKVLGETQLINKQKRNVRALCRLLHWAYNIEDRAVPALKSQGLQEMPPDAGIYLCWYSQLRELINREPRLASRLRVCALPGGGFTGDWFIGVRKGSISLALGQQIIKILCDLPEDNKRYIQGVGLPVSASFYLSGQGGPRFYAWPHGVDVSLKYVKNIYDQSHSRAEIKGYPNFRIALSVLARQLAPPDLLVKPSVQDMKTALKDAKPIVERVFAHIEALRSKESA